MNSTMSWEFVNFVQFWKSISFIKIPILNYVFLQKKGGKDDSDTQYLWILPKDWTAKVESTKMHLVFL